MGEIESRGMKAKQQKEEKRRNLKRQIQAVNLQENNPLFAEVKE